MTQRCKVTDSNTRLVKNNTIVKSYCGNGSVFCGLSINLQFMNLSSLDLAKRWIISS